MSFAKNASEFDSDMSEQNMYFDEDRAEDETETFDDCRSDHDDDDEFWDCIEEEREDPPEPLPTAIGGEDDVVSKGAQMGMTGCMQIGKRQIVKYNGPPSRVNFHRVELHFEPTETDENGFVTRCRERSCNTDPDRHEAAPKKMDDNLKKWKVDGDAIKEFEKNKGRIVHARPQDNRMRKDPLFKSLEGIASASQMTREAWEDPPLRAAFQGKCTATNVGDELVTYRPFEGRLSELHQYPWYNPLPILKYKVNGNIKYLIYRPRTWNTPASDKEIGEGSVQYHYTPDPEELEDPQKVDELIGKDASYFEIDATLFTLWDDEMPQEKATRPDDDRCLWTGIKNYEHWVSSGIPWFTFSGFKGTSLAEPMAGIETTNIA